MEFDTHSGPWVPGPLGCLCDAAAGALGRSMLPSSCHHSLHTINLVAHSLAVPCLAQRTHAIRLGWRVTHSLPKDLLNSAFLDTEVLHRTYTGRTLQSCVPHSSACSSAALASVSSAASGSLRDACFSASDIPSFIVRIVLSLLQRPPPTRHTRPRLTVSAPLRCAKRDFEGGDT
jgi:hypothetical protein